MPRKKKPPYRHLTLAQEVKRLQKLQRERKPSREDKLRNPSRIPPRTHPLPYPLNTVEGWIQTDELLKACKDQIRRKRERYYIIMWFWHEALRRAPLTIEEMRQFWDDIVVLKYDAHDQLLGSKRRVPMVFEMPALPPELQVSYAVQELAQNAQLDARNVNLALDPEQSDALLLARVKEELKVKRMALLGSTRHARGRGKHHSLGRMMDVLQMYDKKKRTKIKWLAVAPLSRTFRQTSPESISNKASELFSLMTSTARQGIEPFFSTFF